MKEQFQTYAFSHGLFDERTRVLAAVSGGVDSVVLVKLLDSVGVQFSIAHCNFQLRAKESDGDEVLVKRLAKEHNVPFFAKRFETGAYAEERKISIQMAARELRYRWFEELIQQQDLDCIATAHHHDDNVETFFLNLVRGTGIRGLTGMDPVNKHIIRPLLFARKDDIRTFAHHNNVTYREDSSNADPKYGRNFLRKEILPKLEEMNPGFVETMRNNMENLRLTESVYLNYLEELKREIVEQDADLVKLKISSLRELSSLPALLYELISPYGFSTANVSDIINALDGDSGKQFLSKTHRLVKDRKFLIINVNDNPGFSRDAFVIEENTRHISKPLALSFERKSRRGLVIPRSDRTACLDLAKLVYPLKLRAWTNGDYMYPLGMKGRKKLSDIFIDNKIPMNEKENIFVLESNGEIAWVVGHKIDERFKTTETTEEVCLIELTNGE